MKLLIIDDDALVCASLPTLLVFRNGKLVNQAVGARPKAGVLALLG